MDKINLKKIVNIWDTNKMTFEEYQKIAKENMINIFSLDSEDKIRPLQTFIKNNDHWAIHTYNVFKKSLEIADEIEKETWIKTDKTLLYIMSWMHDSGRFRIAIQKNNDTEKQIQAKKTKQKKAEEEHNNYWVAQIKLGIKKLKEKNIEIDKKQQEKIEDYIRNHDFFNTRLDGTEHTEPKSLEGQITRLSDRISTSIEEEIERYRRTGKRLKTKYFNSDISFKERINFSFWNMWIYIKSGRFDEFTFLLALLSQTPKDFSNPILAKIYEKRSSDKQKGIKKIIEIAQKEWYPESEIKTMENLIDKYIKHFWIKF